MPWNEDTLEKIALKRFEDLDETKLLSNVIRVHQQQNKDRFLSGRRFVNFVELSRKLNHQSKISNEKRIEFLQVNKSISVLGGIWC